MLLYTIKLITVVCDFVYLLYEGDEATEKESAHEVRTVKLHSKHWVRPFTAYAPFTTPDNPLTTTEAN